MVRILAPRLPSPFAALCLALALACRAAASEPVAVADAAAVARHLGALGFVALDHTLAQWGAVPRTRLSGPGTAAAWRERVPFRGSVYLRLALSAVLQANEALIATRARVRSLVPARAGLVDRVWLVALSSDYGIAAGESMPVADLRSALLHRLDALPPSLVIAKGALDSGWLPSRHVRADGPEFGRWTLGRLTAASTDGAGFRDPRAALKAYMNHLNADDAFAAMRDARARLRGQGRALDGHALAVHLAPALGRRATQHLLRIIRNNGLKRLDRARLAAGPAIEFRRIAGR